MAIRYNGNTMGTFTLVQEENKFPIQIRQGNCLAVFLHIYKQKEPADPQKPWVHDLVCFFVDERHLRNCVKDYTKDAFKGIFWGDIKNIRLNLYYKDMQILLKYMVRDGLEVQCYYKEPKKKDIK